MALESRDWQTLSRLLDEALDLPEAEWAAWCDRQEGLSETLRSALKARLAEEAAGEVRLPELPAFDDLEPVDEAARLGLGEGAAVGPYRLLKEIGQGGMGSVWLAERADGQLKRPVALKLPYIGMARGRLAERFARERDILATLVHPHIARLYDAGVSDQGVPYLAMEYVEGRPLTEHCRERAISLGERLRLFLQVLDAVQYAHGHLVIHRDLKPSNILVNAEGEVRLLDFGIAKLLDDESGLTEFDGRALTPQYAAPEQILGRSIGTAADIYGLGVLLHELLAGALPYRLSRDSRGALEQAILEVDPPPASRTAEGKVAWARQIRGDLDAVVAKALAKEPERRYATVAALADDLRRYLAGEPVLARPASTWYRAGKFVRRHRWPVGAGTVAFLAMMVGFAVATWQAQVAREQTLLARKEVATAKAVSEFMQGVFGANSAQQPDPEKARQATARELLDIAVGRIDESLKDAPEARIELLVQLSELYNQLNLFDRSVSLIDKAVVQTRLTYGEDSPQLVAPLVQVAIARRFANIDDPAQRTVLAEAGGLVDNGRNIDANAKMVYRSVAADYYADTDFALAMRLTRQALDAARTERGGLEEVDIPSAMFRSARLQLAAGQCSEARTNAGQAVAELRRLIAELPADSGSGSGYVQISPAQEIGAMAAWCLGQHDVAEAEMRAALANSRKTFGDDDLEGVRIEARLALWLAGTARQAEARTMMDHVLRVLRSRSPQDRSMLHFNALAAGAAAMSRIADFTSALWLADRALAMRDPALDASPFIATVVRDRARALAGLKRYAEARATLARAIAMREKAGIRPAQALEEEAAIAAMLPG